MTKCDLALGTDHDICINHFYFQAHPPLRVGSMCSREITVFKYESIKNRFSNPNKEQVGQDRQGKDITNDCQGKGSQRGLS